MKTPTRTLWLRAARLKTLPLSLASIVFSSFYAYSNGNFSIHVLGSLCLTTLSLQILSNFANDYGDGVKGTDSQRKERMVGSNQISIQKMKSAIIIMTLISAISVVSLIFYALKEVRSSSIILLALGVICIVAAIKYTIGKNAYGYSGFGDIAVFIFFGLVGTIGSFYVYAQDISFILILPASAIGLLCTAVLNLNNIRDVKTDTEFGKHTLVVKLGLKRAIYYHYVLIIFPLILLPIFTLHEQSSFLYCTTYPLFIGHLYRLHKQPNNINPELKKVSISTFVLSLLLGFSAIL